MGSEPIFRYKKYERLILEKPGQIYFLRSIDEFYGSAAPESPDGRAPVDGACPLKK